MFVSEKKLRFSNWIEKFGDVKNPNDKLFLTFYSNVEYK
jgi:hypothetical protein